MLIQPYSTPSSRPELMSKAAMMTAGRPCTLAPNLMLIRPYSTPSSRSGADVEGRDDDGRTPLHVAAAFNDNPAVLDALVAAGADVESRDDDGRTPLHAARRIW